MRRLIPLAFLLTVFGARSVIKAQDTAQDLLALCTAEDQTAAAQKCLTYLKGFMDAAIALRQVGAPDTPPDSGMAFCLPEIVIQSGFSFGQIRTVVVNWLNAHPDDTKTLRLPGDAVRQALAGVFPCKKK